MHRVWKHILIIGPVIIFITLMGFLLFYPVPKPPVGELDHARTAISKAAKNHAGIYSEILYNESKSLYDSAMLIWQTENQRNRYKRNYDKVTALAKMAADKAREASFDSESNTTDLNLSVRKKIEAVTRTDEELKRRFSKYPISTETQHNISRGEILLAESLLEWERGNYIQAEKKVSEARNLIVPAYEFADADMRRYFKSFPQWKNWADSTIAASHQSGEYSIIVDKFSRKVIIYLGGEVYKSYNAELGKNWVGDKKVRGDKATPEGMYRVIKMFKSDSTKYHKALLLNYPNEEDTVSFLAAIEKGSLPRSAKIGGLIEIHGNGGKGSDWTAGCVAVTDRDMDSIFKIAKIGTPVTIVGSMYDLKSVLRRYN